MILYDSSAETAEDDGELQHGDERLDSSMAVEGHLVDRQHGRAAHNEKQAYTSNSIDLNKHRVEDKGRFLDGKQVKLEGRITHLPIAPIFKDLVEDPGLFLSDIKSTTNKSYLQTEAPDDTNTLIIVSAENHVADQLKQAVATSRKDLHLHTLDYIPKKTSGCGSVGISRRWLSP